jgi:glycosyltransferase involved in cell wall biosynthesis
LRAADRLIAHIATQLLTDSFSQRSFLVEQGITKLSSCTVLGNGSVSGVDVERFRPDAERRNAARCELGIPSDALTILFLGRMTRDKGMPELVDAFASLAEASPRAHLLLVGPDEEALMASAKAHPFASRIHCVGYTHQPERYVAAADLLTLPSHREGFGSLILEAAAAGIPVVASRIYGITDAVIDGETGLLHKVGDVLDLTEKLRVMLADEGTRRRLGAHARDRVMAEFTQARLVAALLAFYRSRFDE